MALPWIIGGLAVAAASYLLSDDDDGYSDNEDQKKEAAVKRRKEEDNRVIREDILAYKEAQILEMKRKYGAIIAFNDIEITSDLNAEEASQVIVASKKDTQQKEIRFMTKEIVNLKKALKELEKER
ncbi:MAG: hypothetical protein Q9M28_02190 [Mariprofundaceae bacterium]|nr:hypothetical protein [Mariprofundaceae bacterium]